MLPHYYQLPDLPGLDTRYTTITIKDVHNNRCVLIIRNQLCKLTAELAVHIGSLKDPMTAAKNVFDRLIDYMPLPPASEDGSLVEVPNLEFTKVKQIKQELRIFMFYFRWSA